MAIALDTVMAMAMAMGMDSKNKRPQFILLTFLFLQVK
jgi:hypothetical protein